MSSVRKIRLRNRINLELVARKIPEKAVRMTSGLDQGHFNRIKNGRVMPTLATAIRIARAMELSVEELFWLEEGER